MRTRREFRLPRVLVYTLSLFPVNRMKVCLVLSIVVALAWLGFDASGVLAEAGPGHSSFLVDGDDGSWIDPSTWHVYEDGNRTTASAQGTGKIWQHWDDTAFMGENSYKVRVTASTGPGNDRSEQKLLSGWSVWDGPRYFTLAFYIPDFTTIAPYDDKGTADKSDDTGGWLMFGQWWQDASHSPPLSIGLGRGAADAEPFLRIARRTDLAEPAYGKPDYNNCGNYIPVYPVAGEPSHAEDLGPVIRNQWQYYMFKVDPGIADGAVIVWKMNLVTGRWEEKARHEGIHLGYLFKRRSDCATWQPPAAPGADDYPSFENFTFKTGTYRAPMGVTTRIYLDSLRYATNSWNLITNSRTTGYHRNLVWLGFDERAGSTTHDQSGSWNNGWSFANHGTSYGASRISGGCVSGRCLYFDGGTDRVEVPIDPVEMDTGNYLTLSAWWRTPYDPSARALVTIDEYSTTYKSRLWLVSDDTVSFTVRHPDNTLSTVMYTHPTASFSDNTWRQLTGTYNRFAPDGQRLKLFLNGELVASASGADRPIRRGDNFLYVGKFSGNYFRGFIDEVMMFNYPFTDAAAADLYASQCGMSGGPACE